MNYNSPYKLNLFKTQSGYFSAKLVRDDGQVIHLHSIVKPEDESAYFSQLPVWGEKIVLLGVGLGYHLRDLNSYFKEILMIDYYQECIDFCKKELFADKSSIQSISSYTSNKEIIFKNFIGNGKNVQIVKHPASYLANRYFYDSLLKKIFTKKNVPAGTGKVMILMGSFFLQEELKNAVLSIGLIPILFSLKEMDGLLEYESNIQKVLQTERPDIVISVNMLGFDSMGILSDLTSRYGIPVAVWFVDDPRPILLHQKQFINNITFAFCWERGYLPFLHTCGFAKVEYLPLATDPGIFHPEGESHCKTRLAFVGSSMGNKFLKKITDKFLWKSELSPLVSMVASKLIDNKEIDALDEIRKICLDISINYPYTDNKNETWFQSYIIHTASMLKRTRLIGQLIPLGIEVFGDHEGWNELYGSNISCHPDIDYRNNLAAVYRVIAININTTSCQMPSAVNQRVFDIPSCGGFVLSDMQSDLTELFENDEIVTYNNFYELKDKITYYSSHPEERKLISCKARARILNEHTYSHRLQSIVNSVSI